MRNFLLLVSVLLFAVPGRAQRDCRSFDYKQRLLKSDPTLAVTLDGIEQFTRRQLKEQTVAVTGSGPGHTSVSLITIPVVVHVVYNTSSQDISDDQIRSQIDVLNADYHKQNPDTAAIPDYYSSLAADCGFRFVLASVDTNGNPTTGIVRKHTVATHFILDDAIKFTARGGDDAWDRDRYLNIWVGNLTAGVLGYSSPVGCSKETDGVVILYTAFGTRGMATAPFNRGRTATHEIGHWLNLIHIWGDANCGDDEVGDTPMQQAATEGNPSGMIFSCGNDPFGNMYMNYMDFTDDIGMHMFTYGQRDRMRTLFAKGGFRYPLLSSKAAPATTGTATTITTGTGSSDDGVLQLFPNPAAAMVQVTIRDQTGTGSWLDIYNQVGQRVLSCRVNSSSFPLSVASLPGGIYFVRLRDNRLANSYKLVKL